MRSTVNARVLIAVDDRVLELVLAQGALVRSRLCRTHVFPPQRQPGDDIVVAKARPPRKRARH